MRVSDSIQECMSMCNCMSYTHVYITVQPKHMLVCMYVWYMLVLILCNVWCIQCVMCESVVLKTDHVW